MKETFELLKKALLKIERESPATSDEALYILINSNVDLETLDKATETIIFMKSRNYFQDTIINAINEKIFYNFDNINESDFLKKIILV